MASLDEQFSSALPPVKVDQAPVNVVSKNPPVNPVNSRSLTLENCPGTVDRATGRKLVVTVFSFARDQRCHFSQNRELLSHLASRSCESFPRDLSEKLITTSFKAKNPAIRSDGKSHYGFIQDRSSILEGIVEGISETASPMGPIYQIAILMPHLKEGSQTLVRETLKVHRQGGKYFLLRPDGSLSEEIVINNTQRRNVMLEYVTIDASVARKFMAGKMALARDCDLQTEIKKLGYSSNGQAVERPRAPGAR
jgi:hypothetical protein